MTAHCKENGGKQEAIFVYYALTALNAVELNYAQIEIALLAVVFVLKNFQQNLWKNCDGTNGLVIQMVFKELETIFRKPKGNVAVHMQYMLL